MSPLSASQTLVGESDSSANTPITVYCAGTGPKQQRQRPCSETLETVNQRKSFSLLRWLHHSNGRLGSTMILCWNCGLNSLVSDEPDICMCKYMHIHMCTCVHGTPSYTSAYTHTNAPHKHTMRYISLSCWPKILHWNPQTTQTIAKAMGCSPQIESKKQLLKWLP